MKDTAPAQSISGAKRTSFWVKAAGGYFLCSLSAVAALIAVLRWYSLPQTPQEVIPRLVISAVWMILSLTCIAVLVHLASDFRRRYRLQREGALVRDLYPDRQHLIAHYGNVMKDASSEFKVMGISLHTFTSDPQLEQNAREALTAESKLEISLVFMRPYCEFVMQREKIEGRPAGRISADCLKNHEDALNIKDRLGNLANRFHVYQVDTIPAGFVLQRDDEIYFEPYLDKTIGRTCPTFVIKRNPDNAVAFDKFVAHIDASIRPQDEQPKLAECPHSHVSTFGQSTSRNSIRKAIFLDRDGVLVEDTGYISSPDRLKPLPGVARALRPLQRDFRLIIVTNQSGIARGFFTEADLHEINTRLLAMLEDEDVKIDAIYYCPHHPSAETVLYRSDCSFRKPAPGMTLSAAENFGLDLQQCFTVGDSIRDLKAGKAAGTKTILVGTPQGGQHPSEFIDFAIENLARLGQIIAEANGQQSDGEQ